MLVLLVLSSPAHALGTCEWEDIVLTGQFTADHNGGDRNYHLRASHELMGDGVRVRATYACQVKSGDLDCRVSLDFGDETARYDFEAFTSGQTARMTGYEWSVGDVDGAAEAVIAEGGTGLHALVLDCGVRGLLQYVSG